MKICCIGAGYVGGPTMAVIAQKCPDIHVSVVDINQARIDQWNSENLPVYEPGLYDVVKETRNRNLFFSTNLSEAIETSDIIFMAVNTPTKNFGEGANKAADLSYIESCAMQIAKCAKGKKIIVEKATVPVKTAAAIKSILANSEHPEDFQIVSNPEFLAEGTAISDLNNPDRILIGGDIDTPEGLKAVNTVVDLYARWVDRKKIITTNLWSSELSKLTANAFLAQRISSINSISALCEATGANVYEVASAIGADHRIGKNFLKSSVGFGGSCFQKDVLNLSYLCEYYGLTKVAQYWQSVVDMNNYQKYRFAKGVCQALFNTMSTKKIAVFGYAFKADTNDIRETPAIDVCRYFLNERANISVYDPKVEPEKIFSSLGANETDNHIKVCKTPYEAATGANAIVVLTDWQEFSKLDYAKVKEQMASPAWVFDGRNCLDKQALKKLGFNVYTIGVGVLQ